MHLLALETVIVILTTINEMENKYGMESSETEAVFSNNHPRTGNHQRSFGTIIDQVRPDERI